MKMTWAKHPNSIDGEKPNPVPKNRRTLAHGSPFMASHEMRAGCSRRQQWLNVGFDFSVRLLLYSVDRGPVQWRKTKAKYEWRKSISRQFN